jgi:hypothetical protein
LARSSGASIRRRSFSAPYSDVLLRVAIRDNDAGPRMVANWYARNLRIVGEIFAVARPGDRILVLFRHAHAAIFRYLLRTMAGVALADPLSFVPAPVWNLSGDEESQAAGDRALSAHRWDASRRRRHQGHRAKRGGPRAARSGARAGPVRGARHGGARRSGAGQPSGPVTVRDRPGGRCRCRARATAQR